MLLVITKWITNLLLIERGGLKKGLLRVRMPKQYFRKPFVLFVFKQNEEEPPPPPTPPKKKKKNKKKKKKKNQHIYLAKKV